MGRAITGIDDHLLNYLLASISRAKRIRLNVAFLMESGVKLLGPALEEAVQGQAEIKILTGRYMSVTEPSAIYYLLDKLEGRADLRFYSDQVRSFHPKAYIFDYDDDAEVYIGSSNISKSALTFGLEWNYALLKSSNPDAYEHFSLAFDDLFHNSAEIIDHAVLKNYTLGWRKPAYARVEQVLAELQASAEQVEPRGAQVEALYELKNARAEGVEKGLVVAATGVGKTYLAAFDALSFNRVLFLAHREEILRQARASFEMVSSRRQAGYYTGDQKDENLELCFASVQTLSKSRHLERFSRDYFDYIVVDEFHHAAADSYLKVIEYFEPKFLLGLTATPYRMDNRDIFALCDDNVIYEIYLKDAINRDLLVPFHYYGIHDSVDYDRVEFRQGRYVVEDLERELSRAERADLVLEKYKLLSRGKTLGFCVSISHADYMARFFNDNGIATACVHSGSGSDYNMERQEAVKALESNSIKVLFAVDIFNEGVDIPSINTVMFLRPTESFVVYLQQLGRGLRKDRGKTHLVVLDFIGNYRRAHYIPALLAGENPSSDSKIMGKKAHEMDYPDFCQVNFDFQLLDLFEKLAKSDPLNKRMINDYFRIKDELGRRPTRIDILNGSDIDLREYLKKGWLSFLHEIDELSEIETGWLGTIAEEFLKYIEKTSMTKAYKVPTIGTLLSGDSIDAEVGIEKVGESFMSFYLNSKLHQKDFRDKSNANWQTWGLKEFTDLARKNPVFFLSKSNFFNYDEINKVFYLTDELKPYLAPELASQVKDILGYRRINYFRKRFKEE